MYKTKLQELCQKKQWGLPKYLSKKDGEDHNPIFTTSVFVNGVSFNSPGNGISSIKEATNEAAKLAFLHFTTGSLIASAEEVKIEAAHQNSENKSNHFEDDHADSDEGPTNCAKKCTRVDIQLKDQIQTDDLLHQYKSLLHNYARSNNFELPMYSCVTVGPPHARHFKATVKIDGHTFQSPKFFNTMKEAECAAARVAFTSFVPDGFQEDDFVLYKNLLHEFVEKEGFGLLSYKTTKCGEPHMLTFCSTVEVEGELFHGKAAKSKKLAETGAAKIAYSILKERKLTQSKDFIEPGYVSDERYESKPSSDQIMKLKKQATESEVLIPGDLSALTISDGDMKKKKTTRSGSYLLCNRVRVYTSIPDIPFPKCVTLLPISEDKWVPVTLEFPNEKAY